MNDPTEIRTASAALALVVLAVAHGCTGEAEFTSSETTDAARADASGPEGTPTDDTGRTLDAESEDSADSPSGGDTDRSTDATETTETTTEPQGPPDPLAVDASNPFIYLDDQPNDGTFAELTLAMANSGIIDLKAYLLNYPREPWLDEAKYRTRKESYRSHHERTRQKALDSGFQNLPPAEYGVFEHHEKPASGDISDTEVIGSVGTDRIVEEARAASHQNPVVVACGGDVTTIADAYLQDPSIRNSIVVYWKEQADDIQPDDKGYNFNNSGWSAHIVLSKLATVIDSPEGSARVEKSKVEERVPQPLQEYMLTKQHHKFDNPLDPVNHAGDDRSIILAAYPATRLETRPMKVDGLQSSDWWESDVLPSISEADEPTHLRHVTSIEDNTPYWWRAW